MTTRYFRRIVRCDECGRRGTAYRAMAFTYPGGWVCRDHRGTLPLLIVNGELRGDPSEVVGQGTPESEGMSYDED